ncbi:MAG: cysteine-rich small domain-containing protein [Candidatus Hecatellaceae archaeon]
MTEPAEAGKVKGPNVGCEYYPCHFEGQDCTWCFCPFYPCRDPETGGEWIAGAYFQGKVWSSSKCNWIHRPEVAHEILKEISQLGCSFNKVPREKLLEIYGQVKRKHPPR